MFFSCFGKKRTKRSRHREGAECRAPARQSRPSLCTHPGAHFRWLWSTLTEILHCQISTPGSTDGKISAIRRKRIQKRFRPGRERGLGGEWLGVGVAVFVYYSSIDRLRINALPPADFFGYFLVRRQESNITALKNFIIKNFSTTPVECGEICCGKILTKNCLHRGCGKVIVFNIRAVDKNALGL